MRALAHRTSRVVAVVALTTAGLLLSGGNASAQSVAIDLCAETGTLTLPGGVTVPVWGFARAAMDANNQPSCAGVAPSVPGPVLDVQQGDAVTVVVHNDLAGPVPLEIPGQTVTEGAAAAPAHGMASYHFTAAAPGTFLYSSAGDAGRQLGMGLYGALLVRPPTAGQAYGASTAYDTEAVLVLSAIDPAFNANPGGYDLHVYKPTYWLINGKAYPDTAPVHAAAPGTRVLLRYLNAGYDNTSMMLLGMHERVVARDARTLTNPFDAVTEIVPAGATEDAIATIPSSGNHFALFNRQLHLINGTPASPNHSPGGMMTFIEVP